MPRRQGPSPSFLQCFLGTGVNITLSSSATGPNLSRSVIETFLGQVPGKEVLGIEVGRA
jgi:hypothetical protein